MVMEGGGKVPKGSFHMQGNAVTVSKNVEVRQQRRGPCGEKIGMVFTRSRGKTSKRLRQPVDG